MAHIDPNPLAHLWWWVEIHTGTNGPPNVSKAWYGFWSGFGSDIGEYAVATSLFANAFMVVRHLNCHVTGCKSVRTHVVVGTHYRVCKKHHPDMPDGDVTAETVAAAHAAAKEAA